MKDNNDEPNVMRGVFYGLIFQTVGIMIIWGWVKLVIFIVGLFL